MLKKLTLTVFVLALGLVTNAVRADEDHGHHKRGNNACPVESPTGLTLDQEFGAGSSDITRCLKRRHRVKLLVQINRFCRDNVARISDCGAKRPYALGNIVKVIEDYEVTHGMKPGRDYDIVAVVHSGGGHLMVQDQYAKPVLGNQYEGLVKLLMSKGVKFYYCQNTVRSFMNKGLLTPNAATQEIIPGVKYVTAGITALADFQSKGYTYVQP